MTSGGLASHPSRARVLRRGADASGFGPAAAADDLLAQNEQRSCLLCRVCGNYVSTPDEICRPDGQSSEFTFENPAGRVCKIVTLHNAWQLDLVGPATFEHTWFSGFAWRIALCSGCRRQLGWRFEASAGAKFFGLLVNELRSGPAPGEA